MPMKLLGDRTLAAAAAALILGLGTPAGAAGCEGEYVVQSGDTLSRIASRCDSSVESLMEANPQITSPARLSIGWKLTVPAGDHAEAEGAEDAEGISTQDVLALQETGPVSLRGWIVNGRRCALLATPDGEEYGVVSPDLSFVSGRAVAVEGRIIDDPSCAGPGTVLVTELSTTEL